MISTAILGTHAEALAQHGMVLKFATLSGQLNAPVATALQVAALSSIVDETGDRPAYIRHWLGDVPETVWPVNDRDAAIARVTDDVISGTVPTVPVTDIPDEGHTFEDVLEMAGFWGAFAGAAWMQNDTEGDALYGDVILGNMFAGALEVSMFGDAPSTSSFARLVEKLGDAAAEEGYFVAPKDGENLGVASRVGERGVDGRFLGIPQDVKYIDILTRAAEREGLTSLDEETRAEVLEGANIFVTRLGRFLTGVESGRKYAATVAAI